MKIGIIAALEAEVRLLKEALKNMSEEIIAGASYYSGVIGNTEVVLMQCGMGKVSAALGAQILITVYKPDAIINTGCAGGLAGKLKVGDMVIATRTAQWDLDTIAIGNPRGYISALDKVFIDADKELTENIENTISGKISEGNVYRGLVVSGDQFVSTNEQRNIIFEAFPDAMCAEMEGAAIGHVCAQNKIPFCVIRCMSDTADHDSSVNFAEFSVIAGEKSADYLIAFLNELNLTSTDII